MAGAPGDAGSCRAPTKAPKRNRPVITTLRVATIHGTSRRCARRKPATTSARPAAKISSVAHGTSRVITYRTKIGRYVTNAAMTRRNPVQSGQLKRRMVGGYMDVGKRVAAKTKNQKEAKPETRNQKVCAGSGF